MQTEIKLPPEQLRDAWRGIEDDPYEGYSYQIDDFIYETGRCAEVLATRYGWLIDPKRYEYEKHEANEEAAELLFDRCQRWVADEMIRDWMKQNKTVRDEFNVWWWSNHNPDDYREDDEE